MANLLMRGLLLIGVTTTSSVYVSSNQNNNVINNVINNGNDNVKPNGKPDEACASASSSSSSPMSFSGIVPSLAVTAETAPKTKTGISRSEAGVGALMPWADHLYMCSYLSVPGYGDGTGLYEIDASLNMVKIQNHSSVFANRMIHHWTNSIVIGPYVISANRTVRVISDLVDVRLGAVAEHLFHPEDMIYMISMDGPFYEVNMTSLESTLLFDLVEVLDIPVSPDPHTTGQCYAHFKDALTVHTTTDGHGGIVPGSTGGNVYVVSNGYNEKDFTQGSYCGRLASWDGTTWTVLEKTAFYGLAARKNYGRMIYASGWDDKSAILKVRDMGSPDAPTSDNDWITLRLPKASHAFDHGWQTEWPRIREVETERYLLDHQGMFYELSPLGWGASTFGIRPISQHLRVIPDFTSFRGMLVMGGNEVSSIFDNNIVTGQSQSGLWLGKTDDLWSWGKPQGWGSVWRNEELNLTSPTKLVSDPYLMTGFDKKVFHFMATSALDQYYTLSLMIDPIGDALQTGNWLTLKTWGNDNDSPIGNGFSYPFDQGMSAHWIRVELDHGNYVVTTPANVTATFIYT